MKNIVSLHFVPFQSNQAYKYQINKLLSGSFCNRMIAIQKFLYSVFFEPQNDVWCMYVAWLEHALNLFSPVHCNQWYFVNQLYIFPQNIFFSDKLSAPKPMAKKIRMLEYEFRPDS